jgi:hypothetical protein
MRLLESPSVRWAIAFLFIAVELLLFVVLADLFWVDQLVIIIVTLFLFAILPSILEAFAEKGTAPIESTQRQRAAWVGSVVDTIAAKIRLNKTGPIVSWTASAFLVVLAGGTITESVPGAPIRMMFSTSVYLLLAAYAAPPVRSYLEQKLRVGFSRLVVVTILATGVVVNEEVFAPSVEQPAVVVALFRSLL